MSNRPGTEFLGEPTKRGMPKLLKPLDHAPKRTGRSRSGDHSSRTKL